MAEVSQKLKDLHAEALERFKLVALTENDQRNRELEDKKFHAGDHWPEAVKAQRSGQTQSTPQAMTPVPPRPMLTIRALDQPIAQVINQARNARWAIKVSPKSDGANQETAETIQGMIRAFEYQSHAQTAYLWAYSDAVISGRGYFRINKQYAQEAPDSWDQEPTVEMILNSAQVYLDPWVQNVNDPSQAQWGFITQDIPEDRYKREYPNSQLATDANLLVAAGDDKQTWVLSGEDGQRVIRIAEYFYIEPTTTIETDPEDETRKREIKTPVVMWAKINGLEVIQGPQEWDGQYIPIIPVCGNEMNIGGTRIWEGMIRPSCEPVRFLDYAVSGMAEQIALSTKAPWLVYQGQIEGLSQFWNQANIRNMPYLPVNATTDATGSQLLPFPERNTAEPPIQAMGQLIGVLTNFVRSTTGVPDAALGHVNSNDKSGKAIAALQQASEQGTSHFADNLQRALQHAGVVMVDLACKLCDRPGRVVQILTGHDDAQDEVMLNQPYVELQGQKVPLPGWQPGQPVPESVPGPNGQPLTVQHFDLSTGKYGVVVEVGKSFATRREAASNAMAELASAAPELVPRYADLWVRSMDFPEAEAIAERIKPPGIDGEGGLPPQIQQAIAQLQQENQQLKFAIAAKQAERQADNDADLLKTVIENENKIEVAKINAGTQLMVADLKAQIDNAKVAAEQLRTIVEAAEEKRLADNKQAHDVGMSRMDHVHDRLSAEHDAQLERQNVEHATHHQMRLQDQQGQQQQDQAITQAALQPEPAAAE